MSEYSPDRRPLRVGNRISRAVYTHVLDYTPHIPSISIACAHPVLRYSREAVAGVRVQHGEKNRGDLYLCHEANELERLQWAHHTVASIGGTAAAAGALQGLPISVFGRGAVRGGEFHRLEGVLEHIVSDLKLSGWWLGRRRAGAAEATSSASSSFYSLGEEEQQAVMQAQQQQLAALKSKAEWYVAEDVVALEVDIKRVTDPYDTESVAKSLSSLLKILASPPFQEVQGNIVVSCLRSLTLSVRQLPLDDAHECLPFLHALPLLTKMETFASQLGSLGPSPMQCLTVLKIRNAAITTLDGLQAQRNLRLLDISRCSALQDVTALTHLVHLQEVSISNSRRLSMACDFRPCTELTSVSLQWCACVRDVECVLSAPNLLSLDVSYSHVEGITGLLDDAKCLGVGLHSLQLRGCPDSPELLDALPDSDADNEEDTEEEPAAATVTARQAQRHLKDKTEAKERPCHTPKVLAMLEHIDLSESEGVDDHRLKLLARRCPRLRSISLRECPQVRSLTPLSSVAASLEAVDASYTQVSDINGLSACKALRRIRLRDCFRLTDMAPLTKVAETLEEVDASMATRTITWNRESLLDQDGHTRGYFSPTAAQTAQRSFEAARLGFDRSGTTPYGSGTDMEAFTQWETRLQQEQEAAELHTMSPQLAAEQRGLLALLISPLHPTGPPPPPRQLQAGGIW